MAIPFGELDLVQGLSLSRAGPFDAKQIVVQFEECPVRAFGLKLLGECHAISFPRDERDRMPIIPIPLMAPGPAVPLDLQAVLDRVYDAADNGKYIYGETPQPALSPEDDAWARQFVARLPRSNGQQ